jgi:predicted RNA polymerase sigma factor
MLIRRGLAALERSQTLGGALGPYTLQAAIAACHARARVPAETGWPRIVALYDALAQVARNYRESTLLLGRAAACGTTSGHRNPASN